MKMMKPSNQIAGKATLRGSRLFVALLLTVVTLGGCNNSPRLPKDYGVYILKQNAWVPIGSDGKSFEGDKPDILIFDRRLSSINASPEQLVELHRIRKVDRIVEEIFGQRDGPVIGYTTTPSNSSFVEAEPIPIRSRPVEGHTDMMIISTPEALASGNYQLSTLGDNITISILNSLPEPAPLHKWYQTIGSKGFSYDAWFARTQKNMGEERDYQDRPILKSDYRNADQYSLLLDKLKAEMVEVLKDKNLNKQTAFLAKVKAIEPKIHTETSQAIQAWVEKELTNKSDEGNSAYVVGLGTEAKKSGVLTQKGEMLLNDATRKVESFEQIEREKMARLLNDSKGDGAEIQRFEISDDSAFTNKKYAVVTSRYAYKTPDHPMSEKTMRWHGYLTSIELGQSRSPWNGKTFYKVDAHYSDASGSGNLCETLQFADANLQNAYAKSLADARNKWASDAKSYRLTIVVTSPGYWSPRVYVKGCSHFTITATQGYEVCSDQSDSSPIPEGQEADINTAEWLRFRSKGQNPVTVQLERFPFPYKGHFQQSTEIAASTSSDASYKSNATTPTEKPFTLKLDNIPDNAVPPQSTQTYPGEKYPETRNQRIDVLQFLSLTKEELSYAINEMFARHGADFPKADVRDTYKSFSWYHPRPGISFDQIESEFNADEKANLIALSQLRSNAKTDKLASGHPSNTPEQNKTPSSAAVSNSYDGTYISRLTTSKNGSQTITNTAQLKISNGTGSYRIWTSMEAGPGATFTRNNNKRATLDAEYIGNITVVGNSGFYLIPKSVRVNDITPDEGFWQGKYKKLVGDKIGFQKANGGVLGMYIKEKREFLAKQ